MVNSDETLRKAITALTEGRKEKARELLMQVVAQDPENEQAWLWLSRAASTDQQRRVCLETVLEINPHNEAARQRIATLSDRVTKESGEHEDEMKAEARPPVSTAEDSEGNAGAAGHAKTTRVVAIVALCVMMTCLLAMMLTRRGAINTPAFLAPEPTEAPSPTPTEADRIKEYLEKSAPALGQMGDSLEGLYATLQLGEPLESTTSPAWRARVRSDMEGYANALARLLDIEPPEPMEPHHRELSQAARHFEKASELLLAGFENQDSSLTKQGIAEFLLFKEHFDEATAMLNRTLAEYNLKDYEW